MESLYDEVLLYGVTDGKAVGTYLEQKFKLYLNNFYNYERGNAALVTSRGMRRGRILQSI